MIGSINSFQGINKTYLTNKTTQLQTTFASLKTLQKDSISFSGELLQQEIVEPDKGTKVPDIKLLAEIKDFLNEEEICKFNELCKYLRNYSYMALGKDNYVKLLFKLRGKKWDPETGWVKENSPRMLIYHSYKKDGVGDLETCVKNETILTILNEIDEITKPKKNFWGNKIKEPGKSLDEAIKIYVEKLIPIENETKFKLMSNLADTFCSPTTDVIELYKQQTAQEREKGEDTLDTLLRQLKNTEEAQTEVAASASK